VSISAYLVCRSRRLFINIGKPLRRPDGTVEGYDQGFISDTERAQLDRALWRFLADTAGESLAVVYDSDPDFETIAGFPEIGGWPEDDGIPFSTYLDEPADFVYFGMITPGRTPASPAGVVRRHVVDGHPVDEAFTRRLTWEPTLALRDRELGRSEADYVEITPAEAVAFVERVTTARQPRR
jgi:hypothetical protein